MKKIELVRRKFSTKKVRYALVDNKDHSFLKKYKWSLASGCTTDYATTALLLNKKWISYAMHNVIMNPLPGFVVDHLNMNGLDNRRSNLQIVDRSENARRGSEYAYKYKNHHPAKGRE